VILSVNPNVTLKGAIYLPASKSYSIRAHFISSCADGQSTILNPSNCDDAIISKEIGEALRAQKTSFDVGESGTSLRFLLPLLSFLNKPAKVNGKGTLVGRPNHHLCETLRRQGMDISGDGAKESVPIVYKGGSLKPGIIEIDGSLSSQFISALLIAAPRLSEDSRIEITGSEMVSADYILMTRQILAQAGIKVSASGPRRLIVKGGQTFKPLNNFHVPSDYGLAAFPMAAAALLRSKVKLEGHFNDKYIQSDGQILPFLRRMGVKFTKTNKAITVAGPFALKGGVFSLKSCPDLVPIMSVLALFARGRTELVDILHARAKESDRISDLRNELLKVGAKVSETRDALVIDPLPEYKSDVLLDPHSDHRLAMAFTVLGLKIGCRVQDIECVKKSYPDFVQDMKALGAL
jgi:3-phosphoshikimate 1-carboxyvinyltransferase